MYYYRKYIKLRYKRPFKLKHYKHSVFAFTRERVEIYNIYYVYEEKTLV